jgi:effector-binding domain-containing protein
MLWTKSTGRRVLPAAAFLLLISLGSSWAQTTPSGTAAPATGATTAPASPSPVSPPAAPAATPATPPAAAPAAPDTAAKPDDTTGASPGDASISQAIDVQPRPAAVISGSATWDDGFKTLKDTFAKLNDALAKNNATAAGRPITVFTATDDAGFKYSAMIPINRAPDGKTELTPEVKLGETPGGKAIRFQHRASYDDIDSTYEAITAYLDEKGLESKNVFAEEYLTDLKTSDDPSLEVDIYVFLKP